jgi:hypothetical protein
VFASVVLGTLGGILCGLIPWVIGTKKDKPSLGVVGLYACALSGGVLGLILALPAAAVFAFVVSCAPAPPNAPQPAKIFTSLLGMH